MAYSLQIIFKKFNTEVTELNRIVIELQQKGGNLERDTHIEGCFIRFVVSWERFVEEYFLRCLCGAKTRSKKIIKPKVKPFKNTNDAFKRVNINRRDREKDFIDWLDTKIVEQRINDYFRLNSRVKRYVRLPTNCLR